MCNVYKHINAYTIQQLLRQYAICVARLTEICSFKRHYMSLVYSSFLATHVRIMTKQNRGAAPRAKQ